MAKMANYMWLLAIMIFVIGICPTFSGAAFAQTYTDADNPHGPLPIYAWVSGAIIVGIVTGGGIVTIVRKK